MTWNSKLLFSVDVIVRFPVQLTKIEQARHVHFCHVEAALQTLSTRCDSVLASRLSTSPWKAIPYIPSGCISNAGPTLISPQCTSPLPKGTPAPYCLLNICPLSRQYSRPSIICSVSPVPLYAISPHGHMLWKDLPSKCSPHPSSNLPLCLCCLWPQESNFLLCHPNTLLCWLASYHLLPWFLPSRAHLSLLCPFSSCDYLTCLKACNPVSVG